MTTEGYVRKHMRAHMPPIDKLADAFAEIATPVQLAKMVEEVGEAAGAYIGMIGANPRKGETHTMEDFHKELLDVALTALMLYRNTTGGPPLAALSAHVEARWKRHVAEVLGGVEPTAPPSEPDEVPHSVARDAHGNLIGVGCRVANASNYGEVKGTRTRLPGQIEPEVLVLWQDGCERWEKAERLVILS